MNDRWQNRISEYIDGELTPSESRRFEEHLQRCEECRTLLGDLRVVVGQAAQLEEPELPDRIWEGVQSRLAAQGLSGDEGKVVELPRRATSRMLQPRWLAAAAVLLALLSGASGWLLRGESAEMAQMAEGDSGAATILPQPASMDLPPEVATALSDYEQSVRQLELALEQLADRMDPVSYESIQGNLVTIDRAIFEARSALSADPQSEYLNVHLANSMMRKVRLLQQATRLASNQI